MDPSSKTTAESLSGLIERVTFFNEDTGFAVLKVKVKGRRELVPVVGSLPAVSAGEWLTAEGSWFRDKEHGLEFKAHLLKSAPPTTTEGIEKFLGGGMIKGIGPVYARKMVAKYGDAIFDVIDRESARLEEIEGIGPARRRQIKAAWSEAKAVREIMVFLHSHGVSTSRALRIFKTYGNEAIEKVRANPYALAQDIHGIGFKSADQIAQRVGIPANSMLRACAGLAHLLLEASQQGHCALPHERLLPQAVELLFGETAVASPAEATAGLGNQDLVVEALKRMIAQGELVQETIEGQELVFLPALLLAEKGIAIAMHRLAGRPANYPPIDLGKAMAWVESATGKQLAPSQQQALALALQSRVIIVTGGPGVGKTTLMNSLLRILCAKKVRCLLCAPTGRAAKRLTETTGLEAKTIHRLLEYQANAGGFARNERHPLESDLVVLDEASMVDVPLMHKLLRALPPEGHLVVVGDVDQLPSVGPGMVLRALIDSEVAPVVRLTEVFRQAAGSRIVTNAHRVNQGQLPESGDKNAETDFYFIERDEPEHLVATLLEVVSERIPRKFNLDPLRDIQVLAPMNRGSLGVRELNTALQRVLNPARAQEPVVEKFGWQFRLRDKVIQTENNYDKEVFNGDIGQIAELDLLGQTVTVRFEDRQATYDFGELDEIAPAYAITIHKSQGSEFPVIVMPLATQHYLLLQRNLLYTGITRGKKLVVIIGQKRALAMAVRNGRAADRYSGLRARLRAGRE